MKIFVTITPPYSDLFNRFMTLLKPNFITFNQRIIYRQSHPDINKNYWFLSNSWKPDITTNLWKLHYQSSPDSVFSQKKKCVFEQKKGDIFFFSTNEPNVFLEFEFKTDSIANRSPSCTYEIQKYSKINRKI